MCARPTELATAFANAATAALSHPGEHVAEFDEEKTDGDHQRVQPLQYTRVAQQSPQDTAQSRHQGETVHEQNDQGQLLDPPPPPNMPPSRPVSLILLVLFVVLFCCLYLLSVFLWCVFCVFF